MEEGGISRYANIFRVSQCLLFSTSLQNDNTLVFQMFLNRTYRNSRRGYYCSKGCHPSSSVISWSRFGWISDRNTLLLADLDDDLSSFHAWRFFLILHWPLTSLFSSVFSSLLHLLLATKLLAESNLRYSYLLLPPQGVRNQLQHQCHCWPTSLELPIIYLILLYIIVENVVNDSFQLPII